MLYKLGDKGAEVFAIKTALFDLGYLVKVPTHNRFGSDTERAVRKYQLAKELEVDGIVGPITDSALKTEWAAFHAGGGNEDVRNDLISKREQMLDLIEEAVGDLYVWGAQGQEVTDSFIDKRAAAKPKQVTPDRAARFKKYATEHPIKPNGLPLCCEDCSGLFWQAENKVGLFAAQDSTAKGLYGSYCIPVLKEELQPLDLVFSGSPISHVGIVGRGGKIYEAAGSEIGVVVSDSVDERVLKSIYGKEYGCRETYKKSAWTQFGRLRIFAEHGL